MKKSAHGLKIDRRRNLMNNIEANGLDKQSNITKRSGSIKIRESLLRKAKAEGNKEKAERLEKELEKLYNKIR
mgnify:CR=1 FL=1